MIARTFELLQQEAYHSDDSPESSKPVEKQETKKSENSEVLSQKEENLRLPKLTLEANIDAISKNLETNKERRNTNKEKFSKQIEQAKESFKKWDYGALLHNLNGTTAMISSRLWLGTNGQTQDAQLNDIIFDSKHLNTEGMEEERIVDLIKQVREKKVLEKDPWAKLELTKFETELNKQIFKNQWISDPAEQLEKTTQAGDIILINYEAQGKGHVINYGLKESQKSPFCHVGIMWEGWSFYHSTLKRISDNQPWLERVNFSNYLAAKQGVTVLVIRKSDLNTWISGDQVDDLLKKMIGSGVSYDNKAAVSALIGGVSGVNDPKNMNCGELVNELAKSIYGEELVDKKDAAKPWAYQDMKGRDQVRLDKVK
jgi:hypothetical protein